MISDKTIEDAKSKTLYSYDSYHEHNDCIRTAYEWLDAQIKTKNPTRQTRVLKQMIQTWARRYVSKADVEVAALMHPEIQGKYPHYNISARLTEPLMDRLNDMPNAFKHSYNEQHGKSDYTIQEQSE